MKTAMTELIELLEVGKKYDNTLPFLIDVIKEVYIKKEKEQMKLCYNVGMDEGIGDSHGVSNYDDFDEFYNETY